MRLADGGKRSLRSREAQHLTSSHLGITSIKALLRGVDEARQHPGQPGGVRCATSDGRGGSKKRLSNEKGASYAPRDRHAGELKR
jgi:hypothetical protein